MDLLDILLLAVALAMDCFTVSMVSGVILQRRVWPTILRMSLLMGIFQAGMPFIGWLLTNYLAQYIQAVDHWVAFGLLAFLGGKMIWNSFKPEGDDDHFDPCDLKMQVTLAVATSIDALAVGISLACSGFNSLRAMALPLTAIGVTSFIAGVVGNLLGVRFGASLQRRIRPELLGGLILIAIGVKILITHLAE